MKNWFENRESNIETEIIKDCSESKKDIFNGDCSQGKEAETNAEAAAELIKEGALDYEERSRDKGIAKQTGNQKL